MGDLVDERKLILDALKQSSPRKTKRRIMREIEPSLIDGNDPILKAARREAKKAKRARKLVEEWTNSDFVHYLSQTMPTFGVELEKRGMPDVERMGKIYDKMVRRLGNRMDNHILKEYLDWWMSTCTDGLSSRNVYVKSLMNDWFLTKFYNRFDDLPASPIAISLEKSQKHDSDLDENALYQLGGLPMVVMSKGIVVGHRVSKARGSSDSEKVLTSIINSFSKNVIRQVMLVTLVNAPYERSDSIDFVTMMKPILSSHGIEEFFNMNYLDYFK